MKSALVLLLAVILAAAPMGANAKDPVSETIGDVFRVIPKALLASSFGADVGQEEAGVFGALVLGIAGFFAGAGKGLLDVVVVEQR